MYSQLDPDEISNHLAQVYQIFPINWPPPFMYLCATSVSESKITNLHWEIEYEIYFKGYCQRNTCSIF